MISFRLCIFCKQFFLHLHSSVLSLVIVIKNGSAKSRDISKFGHQPHLAFLRHIRAMTKDEIFIQIEIKKLQQSFFTKTKFGFSF